LPPAIRITFPLVATSSADWRSTKASSQPAPLLAPVASASTYQTSGSAGGDASRHRTISNPIALIPDSFPSNDHAGVPRERGLRRSVAPERQAKALPAARRGLARRDWLK
jgi:hypothetical protein